MRAGEAPMVTIYFQERREETIRTMMGTTLYTITHHITVVSLSTPVDYLGLSRD
jgi:hypothetical protein